MSETTPKDIVRQAEDVVDKMPKRPPWKHEIVAAIASAIWSERQRCAEIAKWSCMVPPDGGSPTDDEVAVADRAAAGILITTGA